MYKVNQIAYNRSKRNGATIKYIVIHDTGNTSRTANARAHYNYFNSGDRGSSADFFVDDKEILCVNDYHKYYTWHCGDGRGAYGITNSNSIGIELCVNSDGDYEKAMSNALTLVKELMSELNIPSDRVVRHYDASRKKCPASMSKNNWALWHSFKKDLSKGGLTMDQYTELKKMIEDVKAEIKELKVKAEQPAIVYNSVDDIPEWARKTIKKLHEAGHLQGDDNGLKLNYDMLRVFVVLDRVGLIK